jgi:hypothetical protein
MPTQFSAGPKAASGNSTMVLPALFAGFDFAWAFGFAAFAFAGRADFFGNAAGARLGRFAAFFLTAAFFLAAALRFGGALRLDFAAARRVDVRRSFGADFRFAAFFFAFFVLAAFLLRLAIARLPRFTARRLLEWNRPCRGFAGGMGGSSICARRYWAARISVTICE